VSDFGLLQMSKQQGRFRDLQGQARVLRNQKAEMEADKARLESEVEQLREKLGSTSADANATVRGSIACIEAAPN
jgi:acyl-homoserine lactone acylase PvdQ